VATIPTKLSRDAPETALPLSLPPSHGGARESRDLGPAPPPPPPPRRRPWLGLASLASPLTVPGRLFFAHRRSPAPPLPCAGLQRELQAPLAWRVRCRLRTRSLSAAKEWPLALSRPEAARSLPGSSLVGGLETLVQMCMKGGSSMLALTAVGDSQLCFAFFWVVLLAWALLSLAAIYWLRKGLVHLPASRLLPIEYGTVTTTSVLGGLVVYQAHKGVPLNSFLPPSLPSLNAVTCPELLPSSLYSFLQSCDQEHKYVPVSPNLSVMGFGIGLICVGCALVGRRKTLKRKYMPHQLGRQAVRQGAQACDKAAHEVRRAVSSLEQHTPRLIKRDARPYHHRAHRHHEVFPSVDEAGEEASRSAELAAAAAAALAAAPSGAPARRAVLREVAPLDSVVVGSGERGGGKTVKLLPDAPL